MTSFGYSVAISGKTAIVGAPNANSSTGAAYVYVKGASGWPTTPTATLTDPAATGGDGFGLSVAVSDNTAIVGAYGTNSDAGAAYVYAKGASGWPTTPTATLTDPAATPNDDFGAAVAISANTAIVGEGGTLSAGAAYLYVKGVSGWPTTPTTSLTNPAATPNDLFGAAVAISGNTAVVGAPNADSSVGAAYLYLKGVSGWPTTVTATLANPGGDFFGWSVGVVSGGKAVVGTNSTIASRAGTAYLFTS